MKTKTQKIIFSALMSALVCVATMIIKIPTPLAGYVNIGDCIVLLTGWILSPVYGFLAAGIGSALADILSAYIIYAPVTFAIKGAMAIAAHLLFRVLSKSGRELFPRILSGISAEIIMVFGYFLFEGFMYGFAASALNIPANATQGVVGLILGVILIRILKNKIKF